MCLILEDLAHRGRPDPAGLSGPTTNNTTVYSAAHTVLHLEVELGDRVQLVRASLANVTHRRVVDHVLAREAHNGLVLGWLAAATVTRNLDANASSIV